MWGISGVCTLALTVAKSGAHYDRSVFPPVRRRLIRWEHKQPQGAGGTKRNRDVSEARLVLCIIPTLLVLLFSLNSKILQTGILQTGLNQFVESRF